MNEVTAILNATDFLEEKVGFLRHPRAYTDTENVEVIETHMSFIFLTDKFVYKLKKPVSFGYLDFSTREARYKYCLEEVRVNAPLAEDTYLGVIPIRYSHGRMGLKGSGTIVDWLVKMKRLPSQMMLDAAIKAGTVRHAMLAGVVEKLVGFYQGSASIYPDASEYRARILRDIERDEADLLNQKFNLDTSVVLAVSRRLFHFVSSYAFVFDERIAGGRVIDAHGDLRPEHICLGPSPLIIDRLEFNAEFRVMDIAEELCFLAIECERLGSAEVGTMFVNFYQLRTQDRIPEMLVNFYRARRALLRAKLSICHLLEEKYRANSPKWIERCESYLHVADVCSRQLPFLSGN
ncbi:MAG TPA: hypothetical protein VF490_08915 [Chryseosolibacter sp.]